MMLELNAPQVSSAYFEVKEGPRPGDLEITFRLVNAGPTPYYVDELEIKRLTERFALLLTTGTTGPCVRLVTETP